jgi:IS5 family transposase
MDIIDFITTVFVMVDDFCQKFVQPRQLRTRGFLPKLSDSEVITMEIVGEYLGFHKDKDIYKYFKWHWHHLFPELPERSNFVRQSANLWRVKEMFFKYLTEHQDKALQILDSMPIEVCKFVRAKRAKLFKDSANYGKWFGQTFFGYRLHLKINDNGMILDYILGQANCHDINFVEPLLDMDRNCWVLGDKGYRSYELHQKLLEEHNIFLHTSLRRIDKRISNLPKETIRRLAGIRRLIETVSGQLEERFSIKKTFTRDLWHLINRITRKIVSHCLCVLLNLKLNRDPLKLESLVC